MNRRVYAMGHLAFSFDQADAAIAHKLMEAFKPIEDEGIMDLYIPQSYTGDGDDDIVDASICIPLLSRAFLTNTELREGAFSIDGCGVSIIPILLEECDFIKSIPEMTRYREIEYLPSDGIPLDQHEDQDAAIAAMVTNFRKRIDTCPTCGCIHPDNAVCPDPMMGKHYFSLLAETKQH